MIQAFLRRTQTHRLNDFPSPDNEGRGVYGVWRICSQAGTPILTLWGLVLCSVPNKEPFCISMAFSQALQLKDYLDASY
jgi:hypothetical protein